ncbi:DNA polymerase IV [Alkalicoccus luteus]|uniref:DNA polymerase IV n=1 Tax=Alkalicoccus luteus TaxID=1237094 RepID=A0A969PSY0_9BACI|nr:DNA polymerase IV [Alkalicoccus luteus]NJP38925.1 DNA polymerase IV [Alkalicoccus luteus]
MNQTIFLIDMQSFFASVEQQKYGLAPGTPLVVSGAPSRPSGVILAASPEAKQAGITNGERLRDARLKCPNVRVVPPHMQDYLDWSLRITDIFETFTDQVEPYSIDEQFMDVSGSIHLFGSPEQTAAAVQEAVYQETGVYARVGIGDNKVLAKMACDLFAKKNKNGQARLTLENVEAHLWPLPVDDLFRAGTKMSRHLRMRGLQTIGDFAALEPEEVRSRWGIHGQVLWMNARGVDYSPVTAETFSSQKAIGNGMTLPAEYVRLEDIELVLLELCDEVCSRARRELKAGLTVSCGASGPAGGFHRSISMQEPSSAAASVFSAAASLLRRFWSGFPVRRLHVSLSGLSPDGCIQLNLFRDPEKQLASREIGYTTDRIHERFGKDAVRRASSMLPASQFQERAQRIGGHFK